ncbi:MAG TPA: hypothetical protein VLV55_01460 [Rhizomicrobium sp.]|nr:hypothetical protein [Rhizomicrobium sp.]
MNDKKDKAVLSEKRSAFLEGAERLDEVQRAIKSTQLEASGTIAEARRRTAAISPDEAWSQKYMTQAIGPVSETAMRPAPEFMGSAPAKDAAGTLMPEEIAPKADLGTLRPMSQELGRRQLKQRSWLGRLLLGTRR